MKSLRRYTMTARATSAQVTRDRIIGAMLQFCLNRWYDEITLRDVADASGVALQTVLNHFSNKEGLLAAMLADPRAERQFGGHRQEASPGDVRQAIKLLIDDYEHAGDAVVRLLALESRVPALAPVLAFGRSGHRTWVERTFPAALTGLTRALRERRLLQLICATDVYTWQLLRRDQGLTRAAAENAIAEMVGILHEAGRPRSLEKARE